MQLKCGPRLVDVDLERARVAIVGYAGRDPASVQQHIDELIAHGVPAPQCVPAVWEVSGALVGQGDRVRVRAGATSGEVEPVLLVVRGEPFVTVGSDHTDRELERTSMQDAKQACAKVVGRECWAVGDVREDWDALYLSSDVFVDGRWQPYQEGALGALLPLDWYLDRFTGNGDTVVFCGTVPAIDGLVTNATRFRGSLVAQPGAGAVGRLNLEYAIDAGE